MSGNKAERRILKTASGLPGKMEKEPTLFVKENPVRFDEIKKFPYLTPAERRIRFNPFTGSVYVSSWRSKREGEAEEVVLEGEIILAQRGRKPKGEAALRWNEYEDIETAIRATNHILERHRKDGGKMVSNTRQVIELINEVLSDFKSSRITKESLTDLSEKALGVLLKAGFIDASKPIKQNIVLQLQKAVGVDSLGRFNPLVSRSRFASCWLKLTRELLFAKNVREKYSSISLTLSTERTLERFYLEQTEMLMSEITGMSYSDKEVGGRIDILKDFVRNFLTPESIKVAPYRRPALVASAQLFGSRDESDQALVAKLVGKEKADEILSLVPINRILKDSPDKNTAFLTIKQRINDALSLISQSL